MRAVQFETYGGPEVLDVIDVPAPHAGPGQIRIAVKAAAVNPSDYKTRAGYMRALRELELPAGLGAEGAGVVDEVGEGVTDVSVGDAVFGLGSGLFAEYAVLDVWAKKPKAMSFNEAAGISSGAEASVRLLKLARVQRGQTILVSGAAGGLGSALIQLAKRRGVNVIGTATEPKHAYLRALGAVPTTYGDGLVDRVRDLAPNGVDAAFDIAGSGVLPELIEITGDPSKVATVIFAESKKADVLSTFARSERADEALREVAQAVEEGQFRMHIDRTFALDEVGAATAHVSERRTTGKSIVVVS